MAPALFISHGSPGLILETTPSRDFLASLAARLGNPRAIVCVSAHWETVEVNVGLSAAPATIHDFSGFPQELYRRQYAAPGDPALGNRILGLLRAAGIKASGDAARGFDHGVWSPLSLICPDASIPVVEVSVQPHLSPAHHLAVGRALAPLRAEGVLIVGSGSATHNLRELGRSAPHAVAFESWLCAAVAEGRVDDLVHAEERAPAFLRNHPTPEHFLPLFAPLGAAVGGAKAEILNRYFEYGALSMAAFLWA
jgi:4,5-DOPA dioxygenase extradiol